jgi:hypothetical protein
MSSAVTGESAALPPMGERTVRRAERAAAPRFNALKHGMKLSGEARRTPMRKPLPRFASIPASGGRTCWIPIGTISTKTRSPPHPTRMV